MMDGSRKVGRIAGLLSSANFMHVAIAALAPAAAMNQEIIHRTVKPQSQGKTTRDHYPPGEARRASTRDKKKHKLKGLR